MAIGSKDIETLWGHYQSEGVNKGVSVSQYFEANGILYHVFEKWYKKRFSQPDVVDCVVDGMSDDGKSSCASPSSFRRDMQADEEDRTYKKYNQTENPYNPESPVNTGALVYCHRDWMLTLISKSSDLGKDVQDNVV